MYIHLITLGVLDLHVRVKGIVTVQGQDARIRNQSGALDGIQHQVWRELFIRMCLVHRGARDKRVAIVPAGPSPRATNASMRIKSLRLCMTMVMK